MVCNNCGATLQSNQIMCSSCGEYVSKETNNEPINEYSKINPVQVKDGWTWYLFITYGFIPFWIISVISDFMGDASVSGIIGLVDIIFVILGILAYSNLRKFKEIGLYYIYAFSCLPIIRLLVTVNVVISKLNVKNVDIFDYLFTGKPLIYLIVCLLLLVVNIIYFNSRKVDFEK